MARDASVCDNVLKSRNPDIIAYVLSLSSFLLFGLLLTDTSSPKFGGEPEKLEYYHLPPTRYIFVFKVYVCILPFGATEEALANIPPCKVSRSNLLSCLTPRLLDCLPRPLGLTLH